MMKKILAVLMMLVANIALAQTFDVQNLVVHGTQNTTGVATFQTPVAVTSGGIGTGTASGTALDNITGFNSTGFLTRTGVGAYSFQSLTNGISLGNLTQIVANTVLANATGSTANVTAFSMPSCSTSSSALNWASGTGFTCNTAVIASNVSGTVAIANGGTGQITQSAALIALLGSSTVPIANGGTNAITAAIALTNLGADAVGNTTNKDVYVSTVGNDSNNGTSWGYAKLTLQAAVNVAGTNGTVHVGSGTWNLTSTLNMQPSTRLLCVDGAIITQPNAQNLTSLIDLNANTANGASIQNCIIDGNRSNNTDNASVFLIYGGTANDVTISGNTIRNGNGYGVDISTGLRPIINYNKWTNFYVGPIYIVTGVAQTNTYGQVIGNTIYGAIGQHAITLNNSDYNTVSGNTINAALQTGMTVNTVGTTVTLTAGPNFSTVVPGSFIILNGGAEFLITSITDNTHLVVNSTPGTLTGVPAAIGPGDLISLLAASHNTISQNNILGGVGGGVVVSNFVSGESTQKNQIIGNSIYKTGEGCIELESENTFSTQVFDNQVRNNNIGNCGVGGTAVASNTKYGIALIDFNPNTLLNTFVDGNYIRDDQGSPTTNFWLGLSSIAVGQVFVGRNTGVSMINPGVAGGITSVSLAAGWGSTASATATSYGDSFLVNVTSSGTGQAASPSVTVNTAATTANNPPVMACQFVNGTGTVNFSYGQTPGVNTSPSIVLFVYNGTPVAGNTYNFICRG